MKSLDNILVSIIVPCYNQAPYLAETLESVLTQTYETWECIIINDGSPDNVEEIALKWCAKDTRFKYLYKSNSGISDTRNYAIKRADGAYILPLDGDDLIEPYFLEEAIKVFQENDKVKLVYSNVLVFGVKKFKKESVEFNYLNMFIENQIPNTAMYKRTDFLKTSGYNLNMNKGLEDWDFWLTLLTPDDIVVKLEKYHYHYRTKEISRSTLIDEENNEKLLLQIFKNHKDIYLNLFNPIRDRIKADYYKKRTGILQNSIEYKIGKTIYYPFKISSKVIKRLFG